jgi:AcrR family transcriptional regulator
MPKGTDKQLEPRPRRTRRPSITNEGLLEKAFELFVELGFEGTSIDAITAEAGIAKRTIYSRYGDKDSLFKAALQHEIEQLASAFKSLRDLETDDLQETLVAIARLLLASVLSERGMRLLQLTGSIARRMPEIGAHNVRRGTEPILGYLSDLFERRFGHDLHCFQSSADAALAFMNLVVAGPSNLVAQGHALDEEFMDRYVTSSVCLFIHGMHAARSVSYPPQVALEDENLRLKKLLAEKMVELDIVQQGTPRRFNQN